MVRELTRSSQKQTGKQTGQQTLEQWASGLRKSGAEAYWSDLERQVDACSLWVLGGEGPDLAWLPRALERAVDCGWAISPERQAYWEQIASWELPKDARTWLRLLLGGPEQAVRALIAQTPDQTIRGLGLHLWKTRLPGEGSFQCQPLTGGAAAELLSQCGVELITHSGRVQERQARTWPGASALDPSQPQEPAWCLGLRGAEPGPDVLPLTNWYDLRWKSQIDTRCWLLIHELRQSRLQPDLTWWLEPDTHYPDELEDWAPLLRLLCGAAQEKARSRAAS